MEPSNQQSAMMSAEEIECYFRSLPPGYQFMPNDVELILYYLKRKILNQELPINRIHHVNIYQYHPQTLTEMYPRIKEIEWYFFSSRERKYLNGSRPDRTAQGGFWKATKRDEVITAQGGEEIGFKMQLDFYAGTHEDSRKTNWKMHEYRVREENDENTSPHQINKKGENSSMRLNDCVLYKIYLKRNCKADTYNNDNAKTSDNSDQEVVPVTNVTSHDDQENKSAIQHEGDQHRSLNASQLDYNGFSILMKKFDYESLQFQTFGSVYRDIGSSSNNFYNQNCANSYDMYSMQISHDPSSSGSFSSPFPSQSSSIHQICTGFEPVNHELSEVEPSSIVLPAHVREYDDRACEAKKMPFLPVSDEGDDDMSIEVDQFLNIPDDDASGNDEVHQDQAKEF